MSNEKTSQHKQEKIEVMEDEQDRSDQEEVEREREIKHERKPIDNTHLLLPEERRMDSLAILLAAESICVATVVIGEKIYIAANELHTASQLNKTKDAISSIYEYFKTLANAHLVTNEYPLLRQKTFLRISSLARLQQHIKPSLFIRIGLPEKVAGEVLRHATDRRKIHTAMDEARSEAKAFGVLYGHSTFLYHHFKKFEDSIIEFHKHSLKRKKVGHTLTENQLAALCQDPIVLAEQPRSGVHAEMQILDYILEHLEEIIDEVPLAWKGTSHKMEIYIGISKLCCLNCHTVLEIANEVFREENIPIKLGFRGAHDRSFLKKRQEKEKCEDSWVCPNVLSKGYTYTRKSPPAKENISHKIGRLSRREIAELLQQPQPKTSMTLPDSDSEHSSHADQSRVDLENELKQHKQFLEKFITKKVEVQEIIKKISIVLELYEIDEFRDLWSVSAPDEARLQSSFNTILKEYNRTHSRNILTSESLLELLRSPELVGEKVSEYFGSFSSLDAPSSSSSSSLSKKKTRTGTRKYDAEADPELAGESQHILLKKQKTSSPLTSSSSSGLYNTRSHAIILDSKAQELLKECSTLIDELGEQEDEAIKGTLQSYQLILEEYKNPHRNFTQEEVEQIKERT